MNKRNIDANTLLYTVVMLAVPCFGYGGQTNATNVGTAPLVATNSNSLAPNPTEITTLDDTTYKSVRILKAEPDGLMIEHAPQTGGIGLSKIKFLNLTAELQSKYGYDAKKASEYEAARAIGEANLRKEMQARQEQTWAAERARAEDNFKARQEIDRQTETARVQAEKEQTRIKAEAERNKYMGIGSIGSGRGRAGLGSPGR